MSLEINVYCKEIKEELIPILVSRLNDFDMKVEVDPSFKFEEDSGFLPFKFSFSTTHFESIKDKNLLSGFELYIEDFDLAEEKENLKIKRSLFDKLRGKKQPEVQFAPTEIENRLKDCTKIASFVWHAGETFQLRFASMTSAILAEITQGVCAYPADEIWYDNQNIVENAFKEISEYELSLKEKAIDVMIFEGWGV